MQIDHPRLRRYRRAVAMIGNAIAAVETFIVRQPAVYLMAAGVKQQLRRVEAVPLRWVPGPVDAVAVAQARPDIGEPAVPDIAAARGQVDARSLPCSSNTQSSTRSAWAEKSAKFTPLPS
jgi:hypothetical protein